MLFTFWIVSIIQTAIIVPNVIVCIIDIISTFIYTPLHIDSRYFVLFI